MQAPAALPQHKHQQWRRLALPYALQLWNLLASSALPRVRLCRCLRPESRIKRPPHHHSRCVLSPAAVVLLEIFEPNSSSSTLRRLSRALHLPAVIASAGGQAAAVHHPAAAQACSHNPQARLQHHQE